MNSFKQLIGLEFNSFYKIKIREDGEVYTINDSIIISGIDRTNRYQIFTDQKGVSVFDLNKQDVHVDGEYNVEEVLIAPILLVEKFIIEKIQCIWDINKLCKLGFVFYSSKENFYFIRLSDEIRMIHKDVYEQSLSTLNHVVVGEK